MTITLTRADVRVGGSYRVVRELGRGSMGVVVLAVDETLDRKVAIKFIHHGLLDERLRARFIAEARAMARVNHPNTLQIHAFGEHDGAPYFVMEYVDGTGLHDWLHGGPGLPSLDAALAVLEQVCDGVAAIHAARTLHRDLKPSNILVDLAGNAHVADLGLAVLDDVVGERRDIVGTPAYMAPEVAFPNPSDGPPDERADVYALACTAYEVLTGRPPFLAAGYRDMVFQHAGAPVLPPSHRRAGLSTLVDDAILGALVKRPADRTPTVAAFHAALRAARDGVMEPRRIVIAEDYDDFREMLTLALSLAFPNTEIESVADGRAALAAFDRNRPSVVIVDLQMPELDGLELTRLLRARDPLGRIPIIVLTASGGSSDWKRLSAMGADRLLVKPVVIDDVVNVVRRSLRERSAASSTAP